MKKQNKNQQGSLHVLIILGVVIVALIGFAAWRVLNKEIAEKPAVTSSTNTKTAPVEKKENIKPADSISTIDTPSKETATNNQYFYYGAPAGQNNASPKKILITLHGTEGGAERDYEIWKPAVADTGFALASLNWWDGSGDATSDYSTPEVMNTQIHKFLIDQGYTANDTIVLEGFSRGSANSYPLVALDQVSTMPMIDVAVSSSGGATNEYFALTTKSISAQKIPTVFSGVDWILACGDKDQNPMRDGCQAMQNSKAFVEAKGAKVLGVLSDPNAGHGALNTSKLNLTKQMFDLIAAR